MKFLVLLILSIFVASTAMAVPSQTQLKKTACGSFHFNLNPASSTVVSDMRIPGDSIITKSTVFVQSTVVSNSVNTIGIGCESQKDLRDDADYTGSASRTILTGAQTSDATATYVETGCRVHATIGAGSSGVTDGDIMVCSDYLPGKTQY